ncbi:hypothetical protein BDZ97DRAFT_1702551 [Flammula alnicola]|nr:hypothetical protein BDZ97DRAFT_1702551 [Flammula alnicola]
MANHEQHHAILHRARLRGIEVVGDLEKKKSNTQPDYFIVVYVNDKEILKSEKKSSVPPPRWQEEHLLSFQASSMIKIVVYRRSRLPFKNHLVGQHISKVVDLLENNAAIDLKDKTGTAIVPYLKIDLCLDSEPEEQSMNIDARGKFSHHWKNEIVGGSSSRSPAPANVVGGHNPPSNEDLSRIITPYGSPGNLANPTSSISANMLTKEDPSSAGKDSTPKQVSQANTIIDSKTGVGSLVGGAKSSQGQLEQAGADGKIALDRTEVDEELQRAREGVTSMRSIARPVNTAAQGIDTAGDTVAQVDSLVTKVLGTLSKFNSVVDKIATIHPYAQAAWAVLSSASKMIIGQNARDESISALLNKIENVYTFITQKDLETIKSMDIVVTRICQQTLECAYFLRDYTKAKSYWRRLGKNLISEVDIRAQQYNTVFDGLLQQFRDQAIQDTVVVTHRILSTVEGFTDDVGLSGMAYAGGAGLNMDKICLDGTRRGILDEITAWINNTEDDAARVFWLSGNAGTGKSSIAHTIARRFDELGRLGSCYCFDRNRGGDLRHEKIFTTIALDLADRDEQIRHALADAVRRATVLKNTTDITQQWKELVVKPAQQLSDAMVGPILIVIDALDESGGADSRKQLLRILAGKLNDADSHILKLPPNLRILLTSRPEPDICNILLDVRHVYQQSMDSIPRASTKDDILSYVSHEIADIMDSVPDGTPLISLASKADGLFEWARLACAYVQGDNDAGLTPQERLDAVLSHAPEDRVLLLDQMYMFTLRAIFPPGRPRRDTILNRFRSTMGQILGTLESLSLRSLNAMRVCFPDEDSLSLRQVDPIVKHMGSLLSGIDSSVPVRPLHASFPEFLTDQSRSGEFYVDVSAIQKGLSFASLGVMKDQLRFNICELESSYLPNSMVQDLNDRIGRHISPELSYSCRFWTNHLRTTLFDAQLATEVNSFFENERLLFWIETLSLLKTINGCADALSSVNQWVKVQIDNILAIAADARRFVRQFGGPISLSTPHLYLSAVPFSPERSILSMKFAPKFTGTLHVAVGRELTWPSIQGTLNGHTEAVTSVTFSEDGKHIVSGSYDMTIRLWDAETGEQLGMPLKGHTDVVFSVAFSGDGKRIVSGSGDKTICIWDAETGEQLGVPLKGHTDKVKSVAFSRDGKCIVSGSEDKTICMWDAETGEQLGMPLEGHSDGVYSVAFSGDGKHIVSGSGDKTIRVWDAESGKQLGMPLKGHTYRVNSVAFSGDGQRITSGSDDTTVRVWDVKTGKQLGTSFKGHTNVVYSVAFSGDGKRIVSGSYDWTIRVWDAESMRLASSWAHLSRSTLMGLIQLRSRRMESAFDGWIVGPQNRLLFWVPPSYRPRFYGPRTILILPESTQLDVSRMAHGRSWRSCYKGS